MDREDRVRGYQNGGYHGGGDMVQHSGQDRSVDRGETGDTRDLASMGYSIYSGGNRGQGSEQIPMASVG